MSDNVYKLIRPNRKPDLLCIGAQKAGTSWLHETLAQHPDIWVPPFKEIHFFDHKFTPNNSRWTAWHIDKSLHETRKEYLQNNIVIDRDFLIYLESIQERPFFNGNWYKNIFSPALPEQIALDVTPEYSCVSEEGVEFIQKFLPKSKFIYIIRDPYHRALSQLRMQLQRRAYVPQNQEEWDEFIEIAELFRRADYAQYIPRWDEAFGDRVLYLPFGKIKSNPSEFLRQIEDFAGLTPFDYNLKGPVHQTDKKTELDSSILELIHSKTAPQNEYLIERFGQAFFEETF